MSGSRLREESFSLRLFGSEKVRLLSWNVGTSPRQLHVCTETAGAVALTGAEKTHGSNDIAILVMRIDILSAIF